MSNSFKKVFMVLSAVGLSLSLLTACSPNLPGAPGSTDSPDEPDAPDTPTDSGNPDKPDNGVPTVTGTKVKTVGYFTTQDINGNAVTPDIFKDNDLTMVNVFATWCSPCVDEMPDLEKLHQQMKEKKVGVVGVVLDVLDENGEIIDDELERAKLLVKQTGVTYPVLLPDSTYFNGRLIGIDALPETFFIDKDGNIVGDHYSGSTDLKGWIEVVEDELATLKGGA